VSDISVLRRILDGLSWPILIILCLTLGLSPFFPEPHIWEKLKMLAAGELVRPLDMFDLLFHGLPFIALAAKAVLSRSNAAQ
jgi:hypothetical protein